MKPHDSPVTFPLTPADNRRLAGLCGQFNVNLRQIEERLAVKLSNRGNVFSVSGDDQAVARTERVLRSLYDATEGGDDIIPERVHLALKEVEDGPAPDQIVIRARKVLVRPRNAHQQSYLHNIRNYDINFGIGPAGTGKTYLAVACATEALANDDVSRIVLVRPAVEAGERLGFLPGDIGQKVDPYLRPLYDALYEMLGFDRVGRLLGRGVIELAPLAYMRGRTLNESFVILDEAQNTTIEQMKMFLTRIGFGSRAVITGDVTQVDLPGNVTSGLRHAERTLSGVDGISVTCFTARDVVRHPLVQRIVEAYEQQADSPVGR